MIWTIVKWILAAMFVVLAVWSEVACSPWRADKVVFDASEVERVTWTNQWNPARFYEVQGDGQTIIGAVVWIPWESEEAASRMGMYDVRTRIEVLEQLYREVQAENAGLRKSIEKSRNDH